MNFPNVERKATDAVARLIEKCGGEADYLRIIKLIYLADRKSILTRGIPIVGGRYFSMKRGPVIGEVMGFVNCRNAPRWKGFISARKGNVINLTAIPKYESLTESELEILDSVVKEHTTRSTDELVTWCHKHCPEYEHVDSGRKVIELESILKKERIPSIQIQRISERAAQLSDLKAVLA